MPDDQEPEDDEGVGFGDKFTRMIFGSIAGFFMTLFAEWLYTKWFIENKKDEDKG